MAQAYAAADIVVSRCGMGVLTELSNLGKPAILIPIPDSHQESNAAVFKRNKAAVVLEQKQLTSRILIDNIKKVLADKDLQGRLGRNIKNVMKENANENIIKVIRKTLK